jgi:hypothetical protein
MYQSSYYREQATRARRLAEGITNSEVISLLADVAQDYDEIAEDLEKGAVKFGIRN